MVLLMFTIGLILALAALGWTLSLLFVNDVFQVDVSTWDGFFCSGILV